MSLLYRLMGVVARFSERLSHTRVNMIPLNWGVMVIVGALFAAGATQTRDAVVNGEKPRPVTIADMLAHRDTERNFVSVRGRLYPGEGIEETHTNSSGGDSRVERV